MSGPSGRKIPKTGIKRNAWAPEEDQFLRDYWGCYPHWEVAYKMKRSMESVRGRAQRLGLKAFAGKRPLPPSEALIKQAEHDPMMARVLERIIEERNGTYGGTPASSPTKNPRTEPTSDAGGLS